MRLFIRTPSASFAFDIFSPTHFHLLQHYGYTSKKTQIRKQTHNMHVYLNKDQKYKDITIPEVKYLLYHVNNIVKSIFVYIIRDIRYF